MAKKLSFEDGIIQLEEIVQKLESGSISLEESFKAYSNGIDIYKQLCNILEEGDAKIARLTKETEETINYSDAK